MTVQLPSFLLQRHTSHMDLHELQQQQPAQQAEKDEWGLDGISDEALAAEIERTASALAEMQDNMAKAEVQEEQLLRLLQEKNPHLLKRYRTMRADYIRDMEQTEAKLRACEAEKKRREEEKPRQHEKSVSKRPRRKAAANAEAAMAQHATFAEYRERIVEVPGVPGFHIAENLRRESLTSENGARIQEVVTVGTSSDVPYVQWPGRVNFTIPDAEPGQAEWDRIKAAVHHCIRKLKANRTVVVHCGHGVNRSSWVAIMVSKHFRPEVPVETLIQDLKEAKRQVNESWQTLTNRHFLNALLQDDNTEKSETEEEEQPVAKRPRR